MSKDGPGKLSIAERLQQKSAEDLGDLEAVIQTQHAQLAESLMQSSNAALSKIEKSTHDQITQIETELKKRRRGLSLEMDEIRSEPRKLVTKSVMMGAVIGATVAMIPWGVIAYLGMSVTSETGTYFAKRQVIRAEETRINALQGIEIQTIGTEKVLMLPANATQIWHCGETQTPCIKLEE